MFLTFGEIMMRVCPEGFLRFRQAMPGKVEVTFAGGEANVCASLALFGEKTRYLTALPGHAIAQSLLATLKGLDIDTDSVLIREKGRLGIYFVEAGANQRSSNVVYDRDATAISQAAPGEYNFEAALKDVHWLHITGITPSLSENAFLSTLELATLAKQQGAKVSCDLNFRKKLWRWKPGIPAKALAGECMSQILPHVDVLIGNEEDASDVLGIEAEGCSVEHGKIDAQAYAAVARAIVKRFPNLSHVAITLRESISATHNNWGGMLYESKPDKARFAPQDPDGVYAPYEIRAIVDRVGGGDSFAAGLIHALNSPDYGNPADAIRFAVAASCLKHSIKGDFNYCSRDEVIALAQGQASGRVRR